jgi:nucleoside 2-deoxyribosyltransferase
MMKVVYVAGPFTGPTPWHVEQNVRRAELVGRCVAEAGASPLMPHANTRFFTGIQTPQFWYDATIALLAKSDGLVLIPGYRKSQGTLVELAWARQNGLPVFTAAFHGDMSVGTMHATIGVCDHIVGHLHGLAFQDWVTR